MPEGAYQGRLAYDSDNDFHIDPDGHAVLTEDGGRTWRYAAPDDTNHYDRYHTGVLHVVKTTGTVEGELLAKYGSDRAEEVAQMMREQHPHHYETQPEDPHFAAVGSHSDSKAPKVTGHTEAWPNE